MPNNKQLANFLYGWQKRLRNIITLSLKMIGSLALFIPDYGRKSLKYFKLTTTWLDIAIGYLKAFVTFPDLSHTSAWVFYKGLAL